MTTSYVFPYCYTGASNLEGDNWPDEGMTITPSFKTVVSVASSEVEQRRALIASPRHSFAYKWTKQSNDKSILATIYKFFVDRKGKYESFALFDFDCSFEWSVVPSGAWVNSSTLNLFSRNVKAGTHVIRVGSPTATPLIASTDYTISTSSSSSNNYRDKLTTLTSQTGTIYHSFTGQRYFVVRFVDDKMDMKLLSAKLSETGLEMIEAVGET